MDAERHRRVSELFHRAIQMDSREREAFLDEVCRNDPDLRDEVSSLLRHDAIASLRLPPKLAVETTAALLEDLAKPKVPERIGPYRIVREIGHGGMGVVYLAEQDKPIRRQVALKLVKWGMDTETVIARFDSERQALALMDHPAIAKIFDAGATSDGRPYFAMEYVPGIPITDYCDKHLLDNRRRLVLFVEVCEAIQHAHQKGIIHRDVKPSNVLVALMDGKAQPKVIDFGVAKATQQPLTEQVVFTEHGVLIGTPEYMSPEQAEMNALDIDTRSDVYSLGVLLYELIVGALPFEPQDLRSAGIDAIRRLIREVEPPRPSKRLSSLEAARSTESARRRCVDVSTLGRELSGDLDWMVLKALEKDRTRRYGSAAEFAADIGHHLRDEPVAARPPSAGYRTGKFVRRHRVAVGFALVGAVALIGFAATMAIQAARMADQATKIAREARAKDQVTEFLTDLFTVSNPSEARGNVITARELLDHGAAKIRETLTDEPEVRAELMATMGRVYGHLGLYAKAGSLLDEALATRRRLLGPDNPDTLRSMSDLASANWYLGRYAQAEALYRETLEIQRRVLGPEHRETLGSLVNLANVSLKQGRYAQAEALYRETLEIQKRILGPDHPDTLGSMRNLAIAYLHEGRYAEGEALYRETLEVRKRTLGADHPDTLRSMNGLATAYLNEGRNVEAEALYRETLEIRKRVLGPDHPETLKSIDGVADACREQGHYAEAEALFHETLGIRKRVLGPDHPDTLDSIYSLGCVAALRGRRKEALTYLHDAVSHGFAQVDVIMKDSGSALASLRGDPEFEIIVAVAKENRERLAAAR